MKEEMQREILKRVDLLAEKIGATGADLFQSYIGHVQIEPWVFLLSAGMALIIGSVLLYLAIKAVKKTPPGETIDGLPVLAGVIGAIALMFFMGFFIAFIVRIPNFYYPEKAAFKEFVRDIGRIK